MGSDLRVPLNKHDLEAVQALDAADPKEWVHLTETLITWLQDINWPVAMPIATLLSSRVPQASVPLVRNILRSQDEMWILNCLCCFVPKLQPRQIEELMPEINDLATSHVDPDVREAAKELLSDLQDETGKARLGSSV